jgi:hypothetical protein
MVTKAARKGGHSRTGRGKTKARKTDARQTTTRRSARKWSGAVTRNSDALTLEKDVFKQRSAKKIAESLKRSADRSRRRKSSPYRSAMSMLTFYINRAGKNLPAGRKKILQNAKDELRKLYDKKKSA